MFCFFAVSIWKVSSWDTHFGFQGFDITSTPRTKAARYSSPSVAKAETTEGLFDGIVGLWTAIRADAADLTERDVLLELSLAEDHSASDSLSRRTRQQDVGSMASTLQQGGCRSEHRRRSLATNLCRQQQMKVQMLCLGIALKTPPLKVTMCPRGRGDSSRTCE